MSIPMAQARCRSVLDAVSKVIVGKKNVLEYVMVGMLAEGSHILFEDLPGLAKSVMAAAFARASGMLFRRVQFTPDLLPSDITGNYVYDQKTSEFNFRQGPIFSNVLLADEINRASPKTQSALLEAMAE
ncbi:MAG TPA: AAA family ATPase, partial [Candidatus Thermoplasmatota archaeon]